MFNQKKLIETIDREMTFGDVQVIPNGKTIKHIYEKYCGMLTLEDLFTTDAVYVAAIRCSSGFMHKADTQAFMTKPWQNAYKLCQRVLGGRFKPRYYTERVIDERGKLRTIKPPTFKCKVVQKVLCDYLIRPLLEPKMVQTNYASITDRGADKMYADIEAALNHAARQGKKFSVVTADFSNYFASIRVSLLMEMLGRYIKDERVLTLINSFSPDEYGLSLGNELSQIPASWFPSVIDHTLKDKHHLVYFRYMDDSLALVPEGMERGYIKSYQALAAKLELKCGREKFKVAPMGKSFTFCKERFVWNEQDKKYNRMINPKIASNERRKIKAFEKKIQNGEMTAEDALLQYKGVRGFVAHHPHTDTILKELDALADNIRKMASN